MVFKSKLNWLKTFLPFNENSKFDFFEFFSTLIGGLFVSLEVGLILCCISKTIRDATRIENGFVWVYLCVFIVVFILLVSKLTSRSIARSESEKEEK